MAAGYVLLLIGLWALGSAVAMPIAIVPVALAAWFFGAAGGAFMAALLGCVHLSFFHGIEHSLGPLTRDALTGNLLLLGIGAGLGLFRSRVRGQLQRQQQSEQRYEIAARGANDGLWDWNLRTDEVYFSAPLAQMLGYAPQELGKNPDEWLQRVHPDDLPRVRRQLDAHLQRETERFECEHRVRRRDGGWLWVLGRGVATADADGTPRRITGWLTDIAARKQSEDQLRHHAFHDKLTGLPNRALFMDRLANAIARSRRNAGQRFALLLLDLDRFKVVNDSLGHVGGDELLESVAVRLQVCLRPGDTIGRLGGDEFLILLEEISRPEDAGLVAERIHASLSAPLPLGGHEVVTTASIGIAVGDQHTVSPHDLLRDADTAMYEAKNLGKGRHVMFDAQMHTRAVERLSMENALREAVDRQQMRVYYQPIVSLDSGAIVGFEALARWMHPELGMVSPAQFIPLAEETGVISEIGQWVLLEACSQLKSWQQQFVRDPPLRVSVNLSVRQMHDIDMIDRMRGALDSTRLAPDSLAMEITESMIMEDQSLGPRLLEALRSAGVKVYMDDFGTGYSSLSYLQRFRVDALKIDGSFVRNLDRGNDRGNVVRSIITLAQSLGLKVVAEGVETEQQLARLRELGCDEAQGYLFSRPVAPDDLEPLLLDDQRW